MNRASLAAAAAWIVVVLTAAGTAQKPAAEAPGPAVPVVNPYRFADWKDGFPVALDWPSPSSGKWYERSRRQALERVVANLQGNTRAEVWHMATEYFDRAPKEAIEPLIAAMDRAMQDPSRNDMVQNTLEAMGRMADERFDEPLRRAFEHSHPAVRQAAYGAIGRSGRTETIRSTFPMFLQMDGRSRSSWIEAARLRLGDDAVPYFQQLLAEQQLPPAMLELVFREVTKMPPARAAAVFAPSWQDANTSPGHKITIAGILHAAGNGSGTAYLHDLLQGQDPQALAAALLSLRSGELGVLRDEVLKLSVHPRAEVRFAVAQTIEKRDGDDIGKVLEVLAQPDEAIDTKVVALRALQRRGRTDTATVLLEDLATATGTRAQVLLNLLAASGDERGPKLFLQRFRSAPAGEGRQFLQAVAFSGASSAFAALAEAFVGPETLVYDSGAHNDKLTTINYVPTLMQNCRGAEASMVDLSGKLAKDDYRRRAVLLVAIGNTAADRDDPAVKTRLYDTLRAVLFDRAELTQLRVQALNLLTRKALTLDDAMRLRALINEEAAGKPLEAEPVRRYLSDFLFEFF